MPCDPTKTAAARSFPVSGLSSYDAMGLAELIRSGQVAPREVLEEVITKVEAINPKLNAVIYKTYDRARARLRRPLGDGPFAGVPLLVKDNAVIAGVRLTRGSRALSGYVPKDTTPFFAAAERAGFILVGVTNMPELGLIDGAENLLYGSTRNPWHLDYSPGGSSGGAAAAVAAGMVPLAHGTDGGGSIRIPASHCGLFGLKASRGRLLPGQVGVSAWPRLVEGCLTRTVRDSALYLTTLQDRGTHLRKLPFVSNPSKRRLNIAVAYEGMLGQRPHPEIEATIAQTAKLCRALGHTVERVKLPLDLPSIHHAAHNVIAVEVARTVDAIAKTAGLKTLEDGFESRALGLREQANRQGAFEDQITRELPVLRAATADLDHFFCRWDVLLTPVHREPIFKTGMRDQSKFSFEMLDEILCDYVAYTSLHNICGTPAMSVPLHLDSRGLPIGSQFAGRAGAEATLLALAYELEAAYPWIDQRADVGGKHVSRQTNPQFVRRRET